MAGYNFQNQPIHIVIDNAIVPFSIHVMSGAVAIRTDAEKGSRDESAALAFMEALEDALRRAGVRIEILTRNHKDYQSVDSITIKSR